MEKLIKLTMNEDNSITIQVDEEIVYTIASDNRCISADTIYNLLSYVKGDKYKVVSVNDSQLDSQVLGFFTDLFTDITSKVNTISAGINE